MEIYKYHSCGNAFLIVSDNEIEKDKLDISTLCERYETDGLIIFKCDPFVMEFYNKDASIARLCGNGIRCLAHYISDKFNIYKYMDIISLDKIYTLEVESKNPFISKLYLEYPSNYYDEIIQVENKEFIVYLLEVGVKHAVVVTTNLEEDISYMLPLYKKLEININLVKIISNDTFEFITYEKGVGFTKSCGTGSIASAFVLNDVYNFDTDIKAVSAGGVLNVILDEEIILRGESHFVGRYSV